MIPFNAALVEEYWERLLGRRLEPRQVVGLEPPSERRSVEQPEYLGDSRLPLHRHRAPTSATRPTGMATQATNIPLIGILLTDIRDTNSPDTQVTRDIPVIPVPQATQATRDTPLIPVLQTTDTQASREIPVIWHLDTRAARHPTPIPVPVTPCMATPAILPSLLAEVRHKFTLGVEGKGANVRLGDLRLRFIRRFKDTLPVQEPGRIVIVVDVPDRSEIREVQDRILGKICHVVDDTVGLVAIVPGDRGNAAVFDPASYLHFTGDNVVFTGS